MAASVRAGGCPPDGAEPAPWTARIPKKAPNPAPTTATDAIPTSGRDQRTRWTAVLMALTRGTPAAGSRWALVRRLELQHDRDQRPAQEPGASRARAAHGPATRPGAIDARDRRAVLEGVLRGAGHQLAAGELAAPRDAQAPSPLRGDPAEVHHRYRGVDPRRSRPADD